MSTLSRHDSATVYAALRERYCAPEYALFFEVANGTGANIRRYADAMAMSLFPSRGLTMHGFEVKVSRGDWKRELDNPHKAEEGNFRYCDHWWIVTPPGIVQAGELPPTWGHLELQAGERPTLRQKVAAPKLEAQPMTRSFIAAFLRRADESNRWLIGREVEKLTRELREKLDQVRKDNQAAIDAEVEERTKRHRETLELLRKIEQISGLNLIDYFNRTDAEHAGRLLKAMHAAGFSATYGGLKSIHKQLSSTAERIADHLAAFDELAPPAEQKVAAE